MARQAACGLLLAVLAVAGRAEAGMTATLSRRRHSAGGNDLFAPGDPLPPCAKVECPPVAIEIPVPQLGASLRKYDPLRWVTLHSSARWKGNDGEGYKDSFLKLIKYLKQDNFMERQLPITTPIVVGLSVDLQTEPGESRIAPPRLTVGNFRSSWTMHSYLHSAVQDDPYAEPTDKNFDFGEWTPSEEGFVAVFHLRSDGEPDQLNNRSDIKTPFRTFRERLQIALAQVGAPKQALQTFYYAMYGSPVDRVEEMWIPVTLTRQQAEKLANM